METGATLSNSNENNLERQSKEGGVPKSSKGWIVGILIVILLVLIGYTVAMFELYKNKKFIFSTYVPPTPPGKHFYPLDGVTRLSEEEKQLRNAVIGKNSNLS